ncbi:MAG TPA: TonB-dependent receptor, partial [Gammaproteobacteria bacterium]
HAGINSGTRGQGYNDTTTKLAYYVGEPAYEVQNWRHFEQLKWRHIASSDHELQLQFYHDYTDTQASFQTLSPLPILKVDNDVLSERYALELEQRFRLSESIRMVWGGEARHDQVTAPGFLNSEEPRHNHMYRAFAHTEWEVVDDYLVNLGAMLEHNDIAGSHLSPRLAINHRFDNNHAMRVSATRAYRTPALFEEYIDYSAKLVADESQYYQLWKSQGNLRSEKITAYEIGWMGNLGGLRNQYDVKLFKEQIRDIISNPLWLNYPSSIGPSTTVYFMNRDWADLQGLEGQLKMYAEDDTMLSFGYSYVQAHGPQTERLDASGNVMENKVISVGDNVPTHTFSWLAEHRFDNSWRGSLAFYHVDHIAFWYETSLTTADLRLARGFGSGESEGEVSIVARDITGAYFDYQDERVINPRLYLSLAYRF